MTLSVDIRVRRGGFELAAAFEARAGEVVALVGPNGAGKSTVLAALAGLVPPAAGWIALDGEVWDDTVARVHIPPPARRVGMVFQDRLLFPHLSAVDNVAFPLRARGRPRREADAEARAWLARLGLESRAAARPAELSGGEAQRVALARALVAAPRLLLLDEPLTALDTRARGEIRALLGRVLADFEGASILVSHDPVDALTLAGRLVILEGGRVTQAGGPADIRRAPRTPYAAELVGLNLFRGRLEPVEPGVGRLVTAEGALIVAWPAEAGVVEAGPGGVEAAKGAVTPIEGVLGLVRPVDVSLHLAPPEGSARNVIAGRVQSISADGERARVSVAGSPPVIAEITLGSVARLGLAEETPVWAAFKAVEVELRLP